MKPISEETTESILAAAKKEFLEYGFLESSLRRISSKCNVSTHTIYTRFENKIEGLSARVNLEEKTLTISYSPGTEVDRQKIISILGDLGFIISAC